MKKLGKSLAVLIVTIFLLFVSVNINTWLGYPVFSKDQLQALQFALTLVGVFLGAHYQLQNLERGLREERRKELRQERLRILDYIESWLSELNANLEEIDILRKLSPKDKSDGLLIVDTEKTKVIRENLIKLDKRGSLAVAKAVDTGNKDLTEKIAIVWLLMDTLLDLMAKDILPGVEAANPTITDAQRAIDKARTTS